MDYELIFGSMRGMVTAVASIILIKYFVYLILAPFYPVKKEIEKLSLKWKIKKGTVPSNFHPQVSVIIPAWNEEVGVLTTINSIIQNTYDKIQIVIVNDGSTDKTDSVIKNFLRKYRSSPTKGKTITYISQSNGGKGSALNTGVRHSKGQIVLTVDADSALQKDAITSLVKYFHDPEIDAVVGNVKIGNNKGVVGMIQKLEYIFGFYFKRVHALFNAEYIFGGACAAFRKSTTFASIGLFDTHNKTEDIEYSMRTKLYGLKSHYAEDVVVYTEGASDLKGLYKQRLRWKKGRMDTFAKYRKLFFSTNSKHSKFLSWFILPYAILGEIQLMFEPMFFTLIWAYTIITGDYMSIGLSSLFILFTFVAAIIFGDTKVNKLNVFLFPSFWMLFYVLVLVEFFALIKSLDLIMAGEDVKWQNWARKGIDNTNTSKQVSKIAITN